MDRRARGGRRRLPKPVGVAVVLLVLAGLLAVIVLGGRSLLSGLGGGPEDYSGDGSGEVTVEVAEGDTAGDIATTLAEADVVASRAAFVEAAADDTRSRGIQPGFYVLRLQMSSDAALDLLLDPASRSVGRVVVPEGLRVEQVLERVSEGTGIPLADLQAAVAAPDQLGLPDYADGNVEGFLFPATYEFAPDATAVSVLSQMVDRFEQEAQALGLADAADALGVTPYEVVVVASLVEREARLPGEFGKVSRVIYNRLDEGIQLGIDATVLYGLGRTSGGLTASDLARETPYNTRKNVQGLPPTPISSPGTAALTAAAQPEEGDWLYYVLANADGTQFYTESYDEFLDQKAQSERDGLL